MSPPAWHAEAKRLREEGWLYREIGERLGKPTTTVRAAITDENKQRRAAKTAWDRAWARSDDGRARCSQCGELAGIGSKKQVPKMCADCHAFAVAQRGVWIEHRWAEGWTVRQIAEALGWSNNHAKAQFARYRKAGYDLSHRRGPEQVANIREGIRQSGRKVAA